MRLPRVLATVGRLRRGRQAHHRTLASARPRGPDTLLEWIPWASPELESPAHLEPLCAELQRVIRGETIEVCVSVPPRHGKSTTMHHLVAMLLVRNPRMRILYASYDLDFAAFNLRRIRAIALRIGLVLGDVDRKEEFTLREGGGVMACGIQSPPTGLGFGLVIVDDPIRKMADALSRAVRERIGEGFSSDLYSRQDPGVTTSYLIVATRWHEDDLTGRQAELGWRVINLPAIRHGGLALAPSWFPIDRLAKIKARNEFVWAALYMGDPKPRVGRLFGDAHLVTTVPDGAVSVFGIDLAHTAKRRSDRHGVLEMVQSGGRYYVRDFYAVRAPLTDHKSPSGLLLQPGFVREIHSRMRARRGSRAISYTGREEDLVLSTLAELRDYPVHVEARKAVTDKRERATPVAAAWNRGDVLVLAGQPWTSDFVDHVVSFTGADGAEDEEVDCLAAAYDACSHGSVVGVLPARDTRDQRLGLRRTQRYS